MAKLHTAIPLLIAFALMVTAALSYGVANSQSANGKYDADGDRLIEIEYLEQLNVIRYDLNGDGRPDEDSEVDPYSEAFPIEDSERICNRNCNGYELVRSLDFDDRSSYASGKINSQWTAGSGWLPIGITDNRFNTIFDGNGHTIGNLYINRSTPLVRLREVGLFGHTDRASIIRAIGLVDVEISATGFLGALAGYNYGKISSKLKPRWDVHMAGGGDRYEGYAGAPLLLIAGWSGSGA